jgi:hypothetical protein
MGSTVRPALMPSDHPLANGNIPPTNILKSLEDRVAYLYEHQRITDLLNEYAYQLDYMMVDSRNVSEHWQGLFTEDCEVTYPFGTYRGRKGLGEWAFAAESRFERMEVSQPVLTQRNIYTDLLKAYFFELHNCFRGRE